MTPKERAKNLVDAYKFLLMEEDTQCGEEILCTTIAKQCALIAVDMVLKHQENINKGTLYYSDVQKELEKL
jgi:hypothetical protein